MDAFLLRPAPPFRLDLTVWTLRRRPDNAVDRWDGESYRRVLFLGDQPVELRVKQTAPPDMPQIRVQLDGVTLTAELKAQAVATVERMLGIWIDLNEFYRLAERDEKLGPLAHRFRGMKPPRLGSVFETLVNAITCQQVTLTLGIRILNKLAEEFGTSLDGAHAFPRAEVLAQVNADVLRQMGLSYQKADYITGLARTIVDGRLDFAAVAKMGNDKAVERLRELRGVGRWTAEYALLRGFGRVDVFPSDDVGARNNLKRWLSIRKPLDYEREERIVSRWQPYAGLIFFHLLLDRLDEAGYL